MQHSYCRVFIRGIAVSFFTLLAVPSLPAQLILYGATGSGGQPGSLFTINTSTGAATLVGPLVDSVGTPYSMTGMAYHAPTDTLYGSTVTNSQSPTNGRLVRIDRNTGLVTTIGPFSIAAGGSLADISFQPGTNTLFGWGNFGEALFTVNLTTGLATQVGVTVPGLQGGGGLAFRNDGTLFSTPDGLNSNTLRTIDPVTGVHTIVAPVTGAGVDFINAMTFDGSTLFVNLSPGPSAPSSLGTIDTMTGVVTYIGANVARMDALEFAPIPEPTSLVLLGIGTLGGWRLRRRVQLPRASQ
jgi:hypothetical protein